MKVLGYNFASLVEVSAPTSIDTVNLLHTYVYRSKYPAYLLYRVRISRSPFFSSLGIVPLVTAAESVFSGRIV